MRAGHLCFSRMAVKDQRFETLNVGRPVSVMLAMTAPWDHFYILTFWGSRHKGCYTAVDQGVASPRCV